MTLPTIALISDYGYKDGFAGIIKGVILQKIQSKDLLGGSTTCPHVIDITHDIDPQDVQQAAWVLKNSYKNFPSNTIFLCIVDPKIGDVHHKPIVAHSPKHNYFFVAPNNGLLTPVLKEGVKMLDVYEVSNEEIFFKSNGQMEHTFYGRDVYAAIGAYLANSIVCKKPAEFLNEFGDVPAKVELLDWPEPKKETESIGGHILYVDDFGNLITNIPNEWVNPSDNIEIQLINKKWQTQKLQSYTSKMGMDRVYLVPSASGTLELTVYKNSAQRETGASVGDSVILHL